MMKKAQIELKNLCSFADLMRLRVNTASRRGTHVFFYIKLVKLAFLVKKHEKTITIMNPENYSNVTTQTETQTYNVHNLSETPCFPFNVLEHNEKFTPILGNMRVYKDWFDTLEECKEYILSKPYSLILALIGETIKIHKEYENEQQELLKSKENETK